MVLNFDMSPFLLLPVDFSHLDLKLNVHVIVMLNSCIPAAGRKMFWDFEILSDYQGETQSINNN